MCTSTDKATSSPNLASLLQRWRRLCVEKNGVEPESEHLLRELEPSAACKLLRTAIGRLTGTP
jgi:hypothetical protein